MEEVMRVEHKIVTRTASRHRISEDNHLALNIPGRPFFAIVADGHGSDIQTEQTVRLARQVVMDFGRLFAGSQDPINFPQICDEVQRNIKKTFRKIPVGAVATSVSVSEKSVTIIQIGDCVVLKFTPDAVYSNHRLTQDHEPNNSSEILRIRPLYQDGKVDSYIDSSGTFCVTRLYCKKTGASVAFTRSFGDPDFRPVVTHEPEVRSIDHESDDELYAVCSDGGEDVVCRTFIRLKKESVPRDDEFMETVERIASEELPDRPRDDITIVFFRVTRFSPVL